MTEISSLYSSKQTVYRKTQKRSTKGMNGDVKHIVFRDGEPVATEIIKVRREEEEQSQRQQDDSPRRIRTSGERQISRGSTEEVLKKKRAKLSERLKNAVRKSQTLWSEKDGIWISYQGRQGFLVKLFDPSNREISAELMSQNQILDSDIPGLLDTGWKIV